MDKQKLLNCFEKIDKVLHRNNMLYIYGAAALILLGEEDRTSLDIYVAGPYSEVDFPDFRQAAEKAGLFINPEIISTDEY